MGIVLMIHSLVRWAIVVVAVVAIVKFAIGWLRQRTFTGLDRGLMAGFSGLMDLQATLGLVFLLWSGFSANYWPMIRIEHAVTMTLAVAVGHLSAAWKTKPDPIRFRNNLFAVLGAMVLVVVGVAMLPQGWCDCFR